MYGSVPRTQRVGIFFKTLSIIEVDTLAAEEAIDEF